MRKNLLSVGIAAALFTSALCSASPRGDMEFLGYSENFVKETENMIKDSDVDDHEDPTIETVSESEEPVADEASVLQEQLVELAKTRSIRADMSDRSLEIKSRIGQYWDKMSPDRNVPIIGDELRGQILSGIREALSVNGYEIVQLELLDLPEGSNQDKLRAVVRATRSLKTRNSYKEIQKNLGEI
ncbi:MAG: hypothetical protein ACOYXC_16620, partial [Candidatus Rifleibacteriota bacterium]